MHQIRFQLALRPRPRWGAHSAPPDPLAGFKGLLLRGRAGKGRAGVRGQGGEEERGGKMGRGRRRRRRERGEDYCLRRLSAQDARSAPVQS